MSYTQLKEDIRAWKDAGLEIDLTDPQIDIAIRNTTAVLNRRLRTVDMYKIATLVMEPADEPTDLLYLPSDVLRIHLVEGPDGKYWDQKEAENLNDPLITSQNIVYTKVGNRLKLSECVEPDSVVRVYYYAKLLPPSNLVADNVILTDYPDLYLYGCLAQLGVFYQHVEYFQGMDALFKQMIAELITADYQDRWQDGKALQLTLGDS